MAPWSSERVLQKHSAVIHVGYRTAPEKAVAKNLMTGYLWYNQPDKV